MGLAWQWSHLRSRNRYRLEVGNYEDEFQRYLDYPDLLRQYEMDLTAQTQAGAAAQHQARRVAEVLAAVRLPFRVVPPATFVPQQGRSEAVFARFLKQHFGEDQLYFNRRVRIDDLRAGMDWYYPDVVYRDESGLCVDLEIDEPYVWSTGEPHHYIGQDDLRNGFFISKNWVVLRFTEEQVMRTPLACCQVLAALVFHLTGRDFAIRQHLERPVAQPQWDWVEAKRLASQASRATYSSRRNG